MKRPSILIVGAGPVGMSAAIELSRRGYQPRIIDQAAGPAGESRALGIHARTLEIFQPAGLSEKLLAAGHPVRRVVFADANGVYLEVDFSHARQTYNFVLILPQNETEQILLAHLAGQGVQVQWNHQLTGLQVSGGTHRCTIAHAGDQRVDSFDLLIGTDGAHSTVRHLVGIPFEGKTYERQWGLADVSFAEQRPVDRLQIKELDGQILAFFPFTQHTGRFIYSGNEMMPVINGEVSLQHVDWQSSFRISHRIVQRYQQGNVFLAGDAAHIHSPVGGRGMNLGIEDAATLAWLIEQNQTERYTGLRLPLGRRVLRFTDAQTRQLVSRNMLVRLLRRRVAPLLLRSAAAQRFVFNKISGADTPRPPWL